MNAKKIIFFSVLFLLQLQLLSQDNYSDFQKNIRSELQTFLQQEGFSPYVDNDGSLNFKKEGNLHWIRIAQDESPIFISVNRGGFIIGGEDGYEYDKALYAVNAANVKLNAVKLFCTEKRAGVIVELYMHSAEEFKYVFYKSISLLQDARDEFITFYNEAPDILSQSSQKSSSLFPVYGITLGETTLSELSEMGYSVEKYDNIKSHCKVNDLSFWDHNGDRVVEVIYMTCYDFMPQIWQDNFGFDWKKSYNEWKRLLEDAGFIVSITQSPEIKLYQERNTFSAEFTAVKNNLEIDLDFDFGNDKNEGYSVDSKNSLFSIRIKQ